MNKDEKTRKLSYADRARLLSMPVQTFKEPAFKNIDDVKKMFGLPASLGRPKSERIAMDSAFNGGFNTIYESLTQHAISLGQFPMTSFIGYGVLQQIAQNGMIRTCIQTVADDMTREWITLTGGDQSNSEKITYLQDVQDNKYNLRSLFNKALATVGYMGGCFLFIDTGDKFDDDLEKPLIIDTKSAELVGNRNLRFTLIDPVNVTPGDYNASNPLKSDYMVPRFWWVLGHKVHSSRLIILLDNQPPMLLRPAYNFLGIPQAQILWDYVLHWNKARETGVNLLEKLNFMVFQTTLDDIFSSSGGGVAELDLNISRLNRYRDNNSIFVCDKETEDVKNVTLTISGATDIIRQALEHIAAINRTPAVKLLGISPAGFNATGESDIRNYYDHIRSKQELNRDSIQTALRCIQLAEYSEIDSSITFKFNELGTEDEAVTAMTAKTKTDMLSALLDRNVVSTDEVRSAVRNDPITGLDFLTEDAPEPMDGQLETDDTSATNDVMERFLASRAKEKEPSSIGSQTEQKKSLETNIEQNAKETNIANS